jgi:hypothetical protein
MRANTATDCILYSMGKRERKTVKGFTISEPEPAERAPTKKRSQLPKILRLPAMHYHQLVSGFQM